MVPLLYHLMDLLKLNKKVQIKRKELKQESKFGQISMKREPTHVSVSLRVDMDQSLDLNRDL